MRPAPLADAPRSAEATPSDQTMGRGFSDMARKFLL